MISLTKINKEIDFLLSTVPPKSTLPILKHILLAQEGEDLTLCSTDLESHAIVNIKLEPGGEKARANGKMKGSFVITKKMVQGYNKIDFRKNHFYWNDIPLITKDWQEFPVRKILKKGTAVPLKILDSLYRAVPFCSRDEMKPALCGVHVYNKDSIGDGKFDTIIVEATTGRYLYKDELEIKSRTKFDFILPARAVTILKKLIAMGKLEKIQWFKDMDFMAFKVGNNYLEVRLIDERYPSVDPVIPEMKDMNEVVLNSKRTFKTFDYIRDVAPIHKGIYTIELNGENVFCSNPEEGLEVKLPLGFKIPIRVGLNIEYLYKILKEIKTEEFGWHFGTPVSATLLIPKGETWLYLLMPVRLDD